MHDVFADGDVRVEGSHSRCVFARDDVGLNFVPEFTAKDPMHKVVSQIWGRVRVEFKGEREREVKREIKRRGSGDQDLGNQSCH